MPVTEIKDLRQFEAVLASTPADKLVVVDFHATWCGPCKTIAPLYLQLSNKLLHATFLKVDVDKVAPVAQQFNVRAMPTFIFLKGGNKIDEVKGANPPLLTQTIERLAGPAPVSYPSGSGSSTAGLTSVNSLIDSRGVHCLNEASSHTLKSLLTSTPSSPSSYLESDADEQLLLTVPFLQPVRLRAMRFHHASSEKEQAPKRIKLFINQPSLGFDSAESDPPTQEFEIGGGKVGEKIDLRLVKFQNVQSLHIFVMSNQGDEETTRIDGLEIFGEAMEATSTGPLQKVED